MTLELLAALGAALSVFVAVGALSGQFSFSERRVAARTANYQRGGEASGASVEQRAVLFKDDEFSRSSTLNALLSKFAWVPARARLLDQADIPLKVGEYILVASLLSLVSGLGTWALSGLWPVGLATGIAFVLVFESWLRSRSKRRLQLFEKQLPVALQVMSTSLKSGFGIMEAVSTVVREMDAPLAVEFERLLDETRIGGSFEDGMHSMVDRVDSSDLRIVARALEMHRRVGGDLASILDQVAETMREREALRGHILALTAQQRLGGIIVGLLPVWVVAFFLLADPDFVSPLWTDEVGRVLLGLGAGLEIVAFLVMRRIMAIEV
ncbi:MAG: type II secretion system F family protein [Dehalococcoidia bacterium]